MENDFDIAVYKFLFDRGITMEQFTKFLEKDGEEVNFKSPKIIFALVRFYIKKTWDEYKQKKRYLCKQ
ncbi:hypothetical protein GAMM_200032 [Gammaproteobacteria bacterium]